jgi:hypothetical protein
LEGGTVPGHVAQRATGPFRAAVLAAAIALSGCASDVPVPFVDLSIPTPPVIPANHPSNQQAGFPAIAPPPDRDDNTPTMNEVERTRLENRLKKLGNESEARVKQRIESGR